MNYYTTRVQQLNFDLYPKDYLTRHVIKAKRFMEKYFFETIDLDSIGREAHLSKYHLIRAFKYYYGCTPHQYLIEVRIEKAKRMLKKGTSVSDVCIAVGFQSIPSFTRIFKKVTGTSPGRFRDNGQKSNFG